MRRFIGCDIRVDPPSTADSTIRNVRITGTMQQIQIAQNLIMSKIQQTVVNHGNQRTSSDQRMRSNQLMRPNQQSLNRTARQGTLCIVESTISLFPNK